MKLNKEYNQNQDGLKDDDGRIINQDDGVWYYYKICVVDESTNKPISNAYIEWDIWHISQSYSGELYTNNSGFASFQPIQRGPAGIHCSVSKTGYNDSGTVTVVASEKQSDYTIIPLRKNTGSRYYALYIKDGLNSYVFDANVTVSSNSSATNNVGEAYFNLEKKCYVFETTSHSGKLYFNVQKNGYFGVVCEVEPYQSLSVAATNAETVILTKSSTQEYFYVISVIDDSGKFIVGDTKFEVYSNFSMTIPTLVNGKPHIIVHDGRAIISLGQQNVAPREVYVKCVEIPSKYRLGTITNGVLWPSTDTNNPFVFNVISTQGIGLYYHNFIISDYITGKKIKDANVIFKDGPNGKVLNEQKTNENGIISFQYNLKSIYLSIYKNEYANFENVKFDGEITPTSYKDIKISPNNTIRVVYMGEDESADEPAEGLMVNIYYYDSLKNYINCGTYKTNNNGYIDTLSNNIYTSSNTYYAAVVNYNVDNKDLLRCIITQGNLVIRIPYIKEEDDYIPNEFEEFNEMSINGIKRRINAGNIELEKKGSTNNIEYIGGNDYRINIIDPESINVYDIFTCVPIMEYNNNKSVIGSVDIGLKSDYNDLRLKTINRYSGYYNPIFKDILFYKNFTCNIGTDMQSNVIECPYSNVSFDSSYEDGQGKFGVIKNMWFHKVNDDKGVELIKTLTPYYPLTGQYALDYADYNVFSSNWDVNYYTKQVDINNSRKCQNISSMKNGLCMFGSKYLNVPKQIEIYGFTLGNDQNWSGEWNDEWILNPDVCPGEMMYKEVNNNSTSFYFFIKKRILRFFRDKLKSEFEQYIDDIYTYGNAGVEDDIDAYVEKNVLKLYKLDKIRVFIRRTKAGVHNNKINDDYTTYLEYDKTVKSTDKEYLKKYIKDGNFKFVEYFKQHGFVEVNNVTLSKINGDFDRKLVYNLRTGSKEEFAFSFILNKI